MSGGIYDYVYYKFQDAAEQLRYQDRDPRRAAFAKLLILVGEAMYKIEWVDSGDTQKGIEYQAIDEVFNFLKADADKIRKAAAYDKLKETLTEYFKE